MTKIIDGKKIADEIKTNVKNQIDVIRQSGARIPALAVIEVGDNPASRAYVRNKIKACEATGIISHHFSLPNSVSESELLDLINKLNQDDTIDGILIQLPLPMAIDTDKVINAIRHDKDVDGFHPLNVASLWNGNATLVPCTPEGIMYVLRRLEIELDGKTAVVVGRSNIVGKPIAKLLLDSNATVVMAHSHTAHLEEITRLADILVVAVGKKHFIDSRNIKPGAVVIDVGINRGEDGKLYGDVNFDDVLPLVSAITPVPGGVGPLTVAMLMLNTLKCYNLHKQ
ncbi:MAG: bifunctional methylenetetrahydrofolate dehydrogenase/methenyltetrahydrofolate cyclohydrolase FolD [Muribaculaceae bacterium]|nr:bifunctional methylenetetrahydrofolate dehydrogenase/methenyltetrahydrofolate cyclohydrolase FolD [Muribaculaceae bacterium]